MSRQTDTESCPHVSPFMSLVRQFHAVVEAQGFPAHMVQVELRCGCGQDRGGASAGTTEPTPPPTLAPMLSGPLETPVAAAVSPRGSVCPDCGSVDIEPSGACERCRNLSLIHI